MDAREAREPFCDVVAAGPAAARVLAAPARAAEPERSGRAYLADHAEAWGFRRVECFANLRLNADALWPPTGYAASVPAAAPLVADPFLNSGAFGGAWVFDARAPEWTSAAVPEEAKARTARAALVRVCDSSPNPPVPGDDPVDGGWVEALGERGSAALCMCVDRTGAERWSVRVEAALHQDTVDAFEVELIALQRAGAAFGDDAVLALFAACELLAEHNARRVACAFAECAGVTLVGAARCAAEYVCCADGADDGGDGAELDAALAAVGSGVRVPSWFVSAGPRGAYPLGAALAALPPGDSRRTLLVDRASHAPPAVSTPVGVIRRVGETVFFFCGCTPVASADADAAVLGAPTRPFQLVRRRRAGAGAAFGNVAPLVDRGAPGAAPPPEVLARHFWRPGRPCAALCARYGDVETDPDDVSRFMTVHWAMHSTVPPRDCCDALEHLRCRLLLL